MTVVNTDDFYKMDLKKTHYFINISSSASGSDGLAGKRLAVLADFHNRDHEPVLDVLRDDIPDAIMIPGDIIHGFFPQGEKYVIDRCPNSIAFLEGCSEIAPTYMSVGNHEALLCRDEYDMLRATGVTVLDNEYTELAFQGRYGSMIVSRGLSNPYRFVPRLGNPCEIVYVQFA